ALRAIRERDDRILDPRVYPARDEEIALEYAGIGRRVGVAGLAVDADVIGEANDTCGRVRCANHARLWVRTADDTGDVPPGWARWTLRVVHPHHAAERARESIHPLAA